MYINIGFHHLAPLAHSLARKLAGAQRADAEESRLKAHVGDQMAMMARDHMPMMAHHQAIAAARSAASAEFESKVRINIESS